MKITVYATIALLLIPIISCKDQGFNPPQSPSAPIVPYRDAIAPGRVVVKFVKTVTRVEADEFIRGLSLIPIDLSDLDKESSAHLGLIGTPVGHERIWADSLKTYPAIVVDADLIYVSHAS